MTLKDFKALNPSSQVSSLLTGLVRTPNTIDGLGQPFHNIELGRRAYTPAMEFISSVTLSGGNSVTFSSIPQTYNSLLIRGAGIHGGSLPTGSSMRFNSDTGSNYYRGRLYGYGTSSVPTYNEGTGLSGISDVFVNYNASHPGGTIITIPDYTTAKTKNIMCCVFSNSNGNGEIQLSNGTWTGTSAITSITIYNQNSSNYSSGRLDLYGVM